VLLWIEEAVALHGFRPPEILVHSKNPPGTTGWVRGIDAILRRLANGSQGQTRGSEGCLTANYACGLTSRSLGTLSS
jgi:hypothetical protein